MHLGLGEWPTKQIMAMSLQSRQAFMRQLDGMEGKEFVEEGKVFTNNYHTEGEKNAYGGVV